MSSFWLFKGLNKTVDPEEVKVLTTKLLEYCHIGATVSASRVVLRPRVGSQMARRKQVKAAARTATMLQLDGPFRKGRCLENGN